MLTMWPNTLQATAAGAGSWALAGSQTVIFPRNSPMRKALALLFAAVVSSAVARTTVDFYLDMEAGTNGEVLTTNLLDACTHVAPGAGYWTFGRGHPQGCTDCFEQLASVEDFVVLSTAGTNGVWRLRSPVRVNGVTFDNAL